jgi:hypothetical protein
MLVIVGRKSGRRRLVAGAMVVIVVLVSASVRNPVRKLVGQSDVLVRRCIMAVSRFRFMRVVPTATQQRVQGYRGGDDDGNERTHGSTWKFGRWFRPAVSARNMTVGGPPVKANIRFRHSSSIGDNRPS